ncbi:uncharacterized protein TNIN_369191 [Trichonephila inaurata madagascariensis]|uniref:Uncharacterized protein n=1 Tax=Trichonephila inaurata madagascariensis TaxID=2747483 RepID=A0A8X7CD69_9ARAC|nr:uncharacterized protein TNIN_369191 [Trichonephila inaurata madagascariensis]
MGRSFWRGMENQMISRACSWSLAGGSKLGVPRAVTFIFTDMQTPERYEHALNCYHTTYRRSGALRQWFDQVRNSVLIL